MTTFLIIVACVVWYNIGFWGIIWNALRVYDWNSDDWILPFILGVGGPVSCLMSWVMFRPRKPARVVWKKRT